MVNIMILKNLYKLILITRSKIRLARYNIFNQAQYNYPRNYKYGLLFKKTLSVTLGPEQLSIFFAYIANNES